MTGDDDMWFAPKRYGYGAGLPIAWQGWALLLGYGVGVVLINVYAANAFNGPNQTVFIVAAMGVLSVMLIMIAHAKTRGGWRWRWGDDD